MFCCVDFEAVVLVRFFLTVFDGVCKEGRLYMSYHIRRGEARRSMKICFSGKSRAGGFR